MRFEEQNGRRSMLVKDIPNVETAVSVLQEIVALPVREKKNRQFTSEDTEYIQRINFIFKQQNFCVSYVLRSE